MPQVPTPHRFPLDEEVGFESAPTVGGTIQDLEWSYTTQQLKDIERREKARKKLGGFGFQA